MKCGTMNIKERNQRSLITIFNKFIKERNKVFLIFQVCYFAFLKVG
jgi:hypothetical protein